MDIPELLGIAGGIAGVLSLIANIFSAAGAARSADLAGAVEKRMAAKDRDASIRDVARLAATLKAESVIANTVVNEHEHFVLTSASLTGEVWSERHKIALAEIEKRRKAIETLSANARTAQCFQNLSEIQIAEKARSFDNELIHLRALSAIAQREADHSAREVRRLLPPGRVPNDPRI